MLDIAPQGPVITNLLTLNVADTLSAQLNMKREAVLHSSSSIRRRPTLLPTLHDLLGGGGTAAELMPVPLK
jgi:hypothetical protein